VVTRMPAASLALRSSAVVVIMALTACTQEQALPALSAGEQAFAVCLACHAAESQNRPTGPNLHGLFGRRAATVDGYFYSEPLKASGIVWDAELLDAFIANPSERVPGTFMLTGVPDPVRRAAIVEYLRGLE
jgi:cytochrome c